MTSASFEKDYELRVRNDIQQLGDYSARQQRRDRACRMIVVISAAAVPVLAAMPGVPRWGIGLAGAVAAVFEALQHIFQFRLTSINAMKAGNQLERELNRYVGRVRPYAGDQQEADSLFIERVEDVRESTDQAFVETFLRPAQHEPPAVRDSRAVHELD